MQQEKDLELKLRLMKLLWNMGYFVRKNVVVTELGENFGSYTDIDVMGIKIDEEFNTEFLICDCKSGQQGKTKERLFWLNGLMNYLGASKGIFLRTKMNPMKYQSVANKLNITILSENELNELEKVYGVHESEYFGSFDQNQPSMENSFRTLKKIALRIHNYIKTDYWIDSPTYQIHTLMRCCKNLKKLSSLPDQVSSFAILYSLSELSISLIRFSKKIITIPKEYRRDSIVKELQGGKLEYKERKELLGTFYDFMTKEIHDRYKSKYPISKPEFIDGLFNPPYTKYLVDLIERICSNPKGFFNVPKILDCLAHNYILKDKVTDLEKILGALSKTEHESIQKAITDFFFFSKRSNLLSDELSNEQNSKITEFF